MSDYDEVDKRILFGERVDFTAQYRYERRSSHHGTILDYIY